MAQVTILTLLAMALATSYDAAQAQGIFTDSVCSCAKSNPGATSICINPVPGSPGKCTEGPCKAGFTCDLAGTSICSRSQCSVWVHADTKSGNPDGVDAFDCVESTQKTECVKEDPSLLLQATPNPTPSCIYDKDECTCSESHGDDVCVKLDSVLDGNPQCKLKQCSSGFKCDCLAPTHVCKRSTCNFFIASKVNENVAFPCSPSSAECAKAYRPLKP